LLPAAAAINSPISTYTPILSVKQFSEITTPGVFRLYFPHHFGDSTCAVAFNSPNDPIAEFEFNLDRSFSVYIY